MQFRYPTEVCIGRIPFGGLIAQFGTVVVVHYLVDDLLALTSYYFCRLVNLVCPRAHMIAYVGKRPPPDLEFWLEYLPQTTTDEICLSHGQHTFPEVRYTNGGASRLIFDAISSGPLERLVSL